MKSIQLKSGTENVYPHCYFPVGYIYLSTVNTNPSHWFGGTWEQIKDVFLLCAGSTYTAGKTGGAANHTHTNPTSGSTTLTSSHIPSHTHSVGAHAHGLNSHTHTYAKSNANTNSHTLTIAEMPAHSHGVVYDGNNHPIQLNSGGTNYHINWDAGGNSNHSQNDGHEIIAKSVGGSGGHTHPIATTSTNTGAASGSTANSTAFNTGAWGASTVSGHTHTVGNTGSSSNLPPYLVVYAWKRTK